MQVKKEHIFVLFIAILVGINYIYFENFFKKKVAKTKQLKQEYKQTCTLIDLEILKFNKNLQLFPKIKKAKKTLEEKTFELKYIQQKRETSEDIVSILRTLTLQNKINLLELQEAGEVKDKKFKIIKFNYKASGSLVKFIEFLEMLENINDIIEIESYSLKYDKNSKKWLIDLVLKTIYLEI